MPLPALHFFSSRNPAHRVTLEDAVMQGIAPGRGLYLPSHIPRLSAETLGSFSTRTLPEISFEVARTLLGDSIETTALQQVIDRSITFPAPVTRLTDSLGVLELFHGPTRAFKDFGARFMAALVGHYLEKQNREITVLVATSGDTGGAVASGFLGTPGVRVVVLYPSGKVSPLQEKQLTTLGQNITALEVDGSFDDCQALVKDAFQDPAVTTAINLTSANSINIARLIPQTFYYFSAFGSLGAPVAGVVFSTPSGNFGNLTAGVFAQRMGLPVRRFIAATNSNDTMPRYLATGRYSPKPSIQTISNAMDVGDPSNYERLRALFNDDYQQMNALLYGCTFSDAETEGALREVYERYQYVIDPHGAVGYLGVSRFRHETGDHSPTIILGTAHPAKFSEIVEPVIGRRVELPSDFQTTLAREKVARKIRPVLSELRDILTDPKER